MLAQAVILQSGTEHQPKASKKGPHQSPDYKHARLAKTGGTVSVEI